MAEGKEYICDDCLKEIDDNEVTVEELIKGKVEVSFNSALLLFDEGHQCKRKKETHATSLQSIDATGSGKKKPQFCLLDPKGKVIAIRSFTNEDILAEDWIVIK